MGFMGSIFKVLGFESETKTKTTKKKPAKASYKLKSEESTRPNQIDGVPVYYPETILQAKEFIEFVKQKRAVIISTEACDKEIAEHMLDFIRGFAFGANARFIVLNENRLYLILPEGMEVEE